MEQKAKSFSGFLQKITMLLTIYAPYPLDANKHP